MRYKYMTWCENLGIIGALVCMAGAATMVFGNLWIGVWLTAIGLAGVVIGYVAYAIKEIKEDERD